MVIRISILLLVFTAGHVKNKIYLEYFYACTSISQCGSYILYNYNAIYIFFVDLPRKHFYRLHVPIAKLAGK